MTEPAPLYMIQLKPDPMRAAAWMRRQNVSRLGHDDGYGWHTLLMAAFGELAPKPFRVLEGKGERTEILAYTSSAPSNLRLYAKNYADPSTVTALCVADMCEKEMPGAFDAGQRLGFELRLRPTVRQDRDGNRRTSREKDAFLAALDKLPPRGDRPDIEREDVYRDWLATRFGAAAEIEPGSVRIAELRRTMLLRRGRPEDGSARRDLVSVGLLRRGVAGEQGGGPDAVFTGTLKVVDSAAFHALLGRGLGRHRSFGFGMLLLRPPRAKE